MRNDRQQKYMKKTLSDLIFVEKQNKYKRSASRNNTTIKQEERIISLISS
jgi:hypothetical protein